MSPQADKTPDPNPVVRYPFDPVLFAAIVALVVLGIVMAYSASAVYAAQKYHDAADLPFSIAQRTANWREPDGLTCFDSIEGIGAGDGLALQGHDKLILDPQFL